MIEFDAMQLPAAPTVTAPDGSDVRVLLGLPGGGMAHFELAAGTASAAVTHRSVDEIWFITAGQGEMWRRQGKREETIELAPDMCLTIPLGTQFQFRATAERSLCAVAVTMPPWPGPDEAVHVQGPWKAGPR